jgi:hypothetical protein
MPQLEGSFQPLFHAKRVKGKLQKASVDHCSNVIQAGIDRCDVGSTKTCHVRGASALKTVQLVPEALPLTLGLDRWTTKAMFVQHCQAPVKETGDLEARAEEATVERAEDLAVGFQTYTAISSLRPGTRTKTGLLGRRQHQGSGGCWNV